MAYTPGNQVNAGGAPDYSAQFQQIMDMMNQQKAQTDQYMQLYNNLGISPGSTDISPTATVYETSSWPTGADGQPIRPRFISALDPSTGLLRPEYQAGSGGLNSQGMDALRAEALRTGPSQWRTLEEGRQRDQLAQQTGGQVAQAQNRLAMQGGLRGGAAERIATQGMRGQQMGGQNIARDLSITDEQRRMGALQALPGQELQQAGFNQATEKYNIDKALGEILQKRAADQNAYGEQIKAWGAAKTAAATPSSGGGSSFICSALRDRYMMTRKESATMFKILKLDSLNARILFFGTFVTVILRWKQQNVTPI